MKDLKDYKKEIAGIIIMTFIMTFMLVFRAIYPYKQTQQTPKTIPAMVTVETEPYIKFYSDNDTMKLITNSVNDTYGYHPMPEIYTKESDVTEPPIDAISEVTNITSVKPTISDCPLDEDLQSYIYELSMDYGIEYELIMALIKTESNYEIDAYSGSSCGLMQVNKCNTEYAKNLGVYNLYDPQGNILVGINILSDLLEKYTLTDALTCYNVGETGAARAGLLGGPSKYSDKVYGYYYEYINQ